jgi:hypothetical protein
MNRISIRSALLVGAVLVFSSVSARANTITPGFDLFIPGVSIQYSAELSSGELHPGDGFTIYDIARFVGIGALPLNWTTTTQQVGSLFGAATLTTVDEPGWINVNFKYTGPALQNLGFPRPLFTPFIILTTSISITSDDWLSRDHNIGNPLTVGDGALALAPTTGTIVVTSHVPDGGSTAALLGSVLFAVGMLRRRLSGS